MAEKWYPVIDYALCTECGTCLRKCTHGVFDHAKSPSPVVINPGNCVNHCHGCGNICPVGAITYVGDNSGWSPPNGEIFMDQSCCCNSKEQNTINKLLIEYLYLDMNVCERCISTDTLLESVIETLKPVLELVGYTVQLQKIQIATPELAEQYRFVSSPTIRVNGMDICEVEENHCDCCSDISASQVDCRVYPYRGKIYEQPPKEMLAEAILQTIFKKEKLACNCDNYSLPDNLNRFFDGKIKKNLI